VILNAMIVEEPVHPVFIASGPARIDDDPMSVGDEPVDTLFRVPFQVANGRIPFVDNGAVEINREDEGSHT